MKKLSLILISGLLISCASNTDKVQTEYFKDFQTQLVTLSQKIEALEMRAKRETNIKAEVSERIDKLEEKISSVEKSIEKIKSNPLFELSEPTKLTAVPTSAVISIKADEPVKIREIKENQAVTEQRKEEPKPEPQKKEEKVVSVREVQEKETPQSLYNKGYEMYSQQKFPQAISIFRDFLQKYPKDALADNSQYWIAESYYGQKNFDKAIEEFKKVEKYPDGNKVADAYYKIYLAYLEKGNKKEAEKWKKAILQKFKDSEVAKKLK